MMTADKTAKDDCTTGSCPAPGSGGDKQDKPKMVNVRELPLLGNPYPPKDVIQEDAPSSLELTVRSVRTTIQPYLAPVCAVYQKTSDIISIGAAHSQSALENLRSNQSQLMNALVISSSGLLGVALARRRGIFKKILYGSVFFGGAMAACYPKEAKEKAELTLFIARNKLPELLKKQYESLGGASKSQAPTVAAPTTSTTSEVKSETNKETKN